MEQHERLRDNALCYCLAAHDLYQLDLEQRSDARIAPSALCLSFAIEFFLKSELLQNGCSAKEVKNDFGHDLIKMWSEPSLERIREQAGLWAKPLCQDLGDVRNPTQLSAPDRFKKELAEIGKLHSGATDMALRYPTQKTIVPRIDLLIAVFDALIRASKSSSSIVECDACTPTHS